MPCSVGPGLGGEGFRDSGLGVGGSGFRGVCFRDLKASLGVRRLRV